MSVGKIYPTNEGGRVKIIERVSKTKVRIQHLDEHGHTVIMQRDGVVAGKVRNPFLPKVSGFGYFGVGMFPHAHRAYKVWNGMLERCGTHKNYLDCSVDPRWHNYQTFAQWYSKQVVLEGWQIDKDILFPGNKVYSPETCCIVPQPLNSFFTANRSSVGELPLGVSKNRNKFQARARLGGKRIYLGTFSTAEEAHQVYTKARLDYRERLVASYRGVLPEYICEAALVAPIF